MYTEVQAETQSNMRKAKVATIFMAKCRIGRRDVTPPLETASTTAQISVKHNMIRTILDTLEHLITNTFILLSPHYFENAF